MCGILGWLSEKENKDYARFSSALDTLSHRGPDGRGIWQDKKILLGHRRLSIIDLTKNGHQPMIDKRTGSVLIFNGEIYNYKELGIELSELGHQFIGNSDTEVLLNSLIEWGSKAIPKLNGMWSFAFWSPLTKKLILSRDRFGVKPLYLINSKDKLAFASEPKALLKLFPEYRSVNENTLLDFLGNNLLYTKGESFYQGISVFPPAHYGIYDLNNKELKVTQYWDYPKNINQNITEKEALEEFTKLFEDSVKLRLRSDVPVGVTLSGGLDSSSILTAAASIQKNPINCYTSVYENNLFDEFKWAKIASSKVDSKLIPITSKESNWLNTLKKIAWHMDAPGYSPAVYPIWNLMCQSKFDGVRVLLDGQGADEALAGYNNYVIHNFLDYLKRKKKNTKNQSNFFNHISMSIKTFGVSRSLAWLIRETLPSLSNLYRNHYGFQSVMHEHVKVPENSINKDKLKSVRDHLIIDHSINILPGLLHYGDSISMSHGIEVRNPFLDYRLVEWIFKLPSNLLFNNSETKWVLREYLRRNNQINIGNRNDKKGYSTPIKKWLISSKNNEVESLLLSNENPLLKWVDKNKIKNLINQNKKGIMGAEHHLYKLLSTQIWMQECLYE